MAVDGRMPEVVDGGRITGLHCSGPLLRTGLDGLQILVRIQRALQTKAQRVGGNVLPERRVRTILGAGVGLHHIEKILAQVLLPGIHGVVGQGARGGTAERRFRLVLIGGTGLSVRGRAVIPNDLPRYVIGFKRIFFRLQSVLLIIGDTRIPERVLAVRHQDVVRAAAGQMGAFGLPSLGMPGVVAPGTIIVIPLEIFVDRTHRTHQRRGALALARQQPGQKIFPVLALEAAHAPFDDGHVLAIDILADQPRKFVTFRVVDGPIAHPHITTQRFHEGIAHGRNGHMHAGSVILEPVGKILVFLRLCADAPRFCGIERTVFAGQCPIEALVVLDRHTLVVGGAVLLPVGRRLEGWVFLQVIGGRCNFGDAVITLAPALCIPVTLNAPVPAFTVGSQCGLDTYRDLHVLEHALAAVDLTKRAVRTGDVQRMPVTDGLVRMADVIDDRLRIGVLHRRTILVHPGFVLHIRVVIQRVHLRRTATRGQHVIVVGGQQTLRVVHRIDPDIFVVIVIVGQLAVRKKARFPRVESEDDALQIRIRQIVERHRPRVIQREHQVGFHYRQLLDDQ